MVKKFVKGDYNQKHCEVWIREDDFDDEYFGDVSTDYADKFVDLLNSLNDENEQLKKEIMEYVKIFNCRNCGHLYYDWYVDSGEEFEVCDMGNTERMIYDRFCKDWKRG